jgi:hypothetical protein
LERQVYFCSAEAVGYGLELTSRYVYQVRRGRGGRDFAFLGFGILDLLLFRATNEMRVLSGLFYDFLFLGHSMMYCIKVQNKRQRAIDISFISLSQLFSSQRIG